MVFPLFFQKDFLKMIYRITLIENLTLVEDVTIQQFEILTPLNYNIQLDKLLKMFEDPIQNSIKLLQSPYLKRSAE